MANPPKSQRNNVALLELYKQARDSLEATQQELSDAQTHIAIRAAAARRAATAAEKAQMDTLYDKEVAIEDAISALARGFAQEMSQSDQLKQLAANLKDITAGLQKTLGELQHIAKVADTASQAADFLSKLGQGLIGLG